MNLIDVTGVWRPGKQRKLSWHRNVGLEVVCVTGGTAEWSVDDRAYRVPAGSVFFTFPWEWHGSTCETAPGLELSFAVIGLDRVYRKRPANNRFGWHPELPFTATEGRQIRKALVDSPSRSLPLTENLVHLVRGIAGQRGADGLGTGVVRRALAGQTLVELARIAQSQATPRSRVLETDHRVLAFIKQMESRCHEPWSVESMASACGLGRARLTDLVRKHTGDTPLMLMNRLRVQRAQQQLAESDAKVIDVAFGCGFSTAQHFCRVFRDYTGTTPSQYRKSVRSDSEAASTVA
ncbi:helix-turn-helix domain-containing protein [Algisphaera agarilytica]|uniref:AraC-like DNA-binding protein n=1 Tax=Algisphaera agarilytica TaxID=1385975 RepID=A0A7X0H4W5_9BACT|nr:AraC family transcriptional regulator [Algisphaera agarilytica]MBB6428196.1 AraC-like DNA-binding protein [Algisphaera agarilytica]